MYTIGALRKCMIFLEEIGEKESEPGKADFMAEFWVDMCVERGWVDLREWRRSWGGGGRGLGHGVLGKGGL
jgi:hypothetical protein